jgi:hypothetical protein
VENLNAEEDIHENWKIKHLTITVTGNMFHSEWYCGYVKIPQGHPFHGKHYDEINHYISVHGELTYSSEEEDGYWIGFDTNHYYSGKWTKEMAEEETKNLLRQIEDF